MHQIITLYTVYVCNLTCELYLNNAGKNPWSKHTIMDQGGDWIKDLLPGGMLTLKAKCSLYPKVKFVQSCPTLCNPMDYTDHGVLQARILERVAFSFSRGSSQPRDRTQVSNIVNGVFTVWAIREAQYPKKHCGIVVVFCTCPWLGTYCSLSGSYQWPFFGWWTPINCAREFSTLNSSQKLSLTSRIRGASPLCWPPLWIIIPIYHSHFCAGGYILLQTMHSLIAGLHPSDLSSTLCDIMNPR